MKREKDNLKVQTGLAGVDCRCFEFHETRLQSASRFARAFLIGLLVCWVVQAWLAGSAMAQVNDGKKALSKKNYPWYDAENDGVRRVKLKARSDARASNRNNIPLKKVKKRDYSDPDWSWLTDWFGNWSFSGNLLGGLSLLGWCFIIGVALFVIGLLVYAFMRMNPGMDDDDEELIPTRSMAESIKELPFELETTSGDFRQLAQNAYASGDYRSAITYLFSHVLVSLDQRGLIRLRKGKTNRQYLSELRRHRSLADYYQHVMVPFEAAFFGNHDLEKKQFESCWNQLDSFLTGVNNTKQVANA